MGGVESRYVGCSSFARSPSCIVMVLATRVHFKSQTGTGDVVLTCATFLLTELSMKMLVYVHVRKDTQYKSVFICMENMFLLKITAKTR